MELTAGSNVFDLLACLCSRIPKEDERKFAIKWKTVSKNNVKKILTKYMTVHLGILLLKQ